jgi:hypothetical protein
MTDDDRANMYSAVLAAADWVVMEPIDEPDEDRALRYFIQAGLQETLYALSDDPPDSEERRRHREYAQRFGSEAVKLIPIGDRPDDVARAAACYADLLQARTDRDWK